MARIVPTRLGIDKDQMLRRVPFEPEPLRLADRRSAETQHDFGLEVAGDPLIPQEEIRVPQHGRTLVMRAGSQLRGRIGEDWPAQLRREICQSGAELRSRVHRTAGNYTAFARTRDLHEPFDIFRPWIISTPTDSGVGPAAAIDGADLRLGCDRGRLERIGKWQIEVDGARRRAAGCGDRSASHFARVSQHSTVGTGHSDLGKPTHVCAVEADLVDRLPRAPFAQFGRPIGAEYDQRHVGVVGLDHCWVEVRRRRTGCADERGRRTGRLRGAEGKKARRPLVDLRPTAERSVLSGGNRKGCGARPGADADLLHAHASEFIDECQGKKMRRVRSTIWNRAGFQFSVHIRSPSAGRAWRAA